MLHTCRVAPVQITDWKVVIDDGKPGATTVATPNAAIATNDSTGRLHTVDVRLAPSLYVDATFLNAGSGVRSSCGYTGATMYEHSRPLQEVGGSGYRAGFAGYSLTPSAGSGQLADALTFTFSVSNTVITTTKSVRMGILQVKYQVGYSCQLGARIFAASGPFVRSCGGHHGGI